MMRAHTWIPLLAAALLAGCVTTPDYDKPLAQGAPALIPVRADAKLPDFAHEWEHRDEILPALDNSLAWMRKPGAKRFFPQAGIGYDRALRSLEALQQLFTDSKNGADFQRELLARFQVYESAGWDGKGGGVLFTAYCTPILKGSTVADATYRYPLYGLPPDLVKDKDGSVLGWETAGGRLDSYPTRGAIEAGSILANRDLELVWLRDPIDAYIAHVNGSAFIELPDGSMLRLGYAGKNGQPYHSLGHELEEEGKIPKGQASLAAIREWASKASDEELRDFLDRNPSYVFFTPIEGNPHGSLDVEVTGGRSLATDKTLFPRGAAVFVEAGPRDADTKGGGVHFSRFLFDQDTGGAIRTAGRADVYLGIGPEAEERAGRVKSIGQLYYLFVKE